MGKVKSLDCRLLAWLLIQGNTWSTAHKQANQGLSIPLFQWGYTTPIFTSQSLSCYSVWKQDGNRNGWKWKCSTWCIEKMAGAMVVVEVLGSEKCGFWTSFNLKPFKRVSCVLERCLALFCGLYEWKAPPSLLQKLKYSGNLVFRES